MRHENYFRFVAAKMVMEIVEINWGHPHIFKILTRNHLVAPGSDSKHHFRFAADTAEMAEIDFTSPKQADSTGISWETTLTSITAPHAMTG